MKKTLFVIVALGATFSTKAQNWVIPTNNTAVGTTYLGTTNTAGNPLRIATTNSSNDIRFYTGGSADANEKMRLSANGNFGIGTGTTAPASKLTVAGTLSVTGANATSLGGTLTTGGNVGIGVVPNTGIKLTLGGGTANTRLALYDNSASSPTDVYGFGIQPFQFRLHLGGVSGRFSFLDAPAGNELLRINGSGSITSNVNNHYGGFTIQSTYKSPSFSLVGLNTPVNSGTGNQSFFIGLGTGTDGGVCNGCFSNEAKANDAVLRLIGVSNTHILFQNSTSGSIKFAGIRSGAERQNMEIMSDGRVVIGNYTFTDANDFVPGTNSATFPSASQYKLIVATGILTPKVRVAVPNTSDWSDYVFSDNYKLNSLDSVATYIKTNKHLPGVPSAEDVVKNGIDIAKMDAKLLEKVEELTLYLIELKKQNARLEARISELEK